MKMIARLLLSISVTSLVMFAFDSAMADEVAFPLQAKRILFLGDSITDAGYYVADIEIQLRLHAQQPLPEMINLGLPSETCSGLSEPDHPFPRPDVHERIDRALAKAKPDVVVACYGMNDGIYYPFGEERFQKYQAGIEKIIEKVHASGAELVLLTPPPFDAVPLQGKNKLRPAGADKYAWFAVYEHYDKEVMRRYADWIKTQVGKADMVIDTYTPMAKCLADKRKTDPKFHFAADGVHMDAAGHEVLAKAILQAWGIETWRQADDELRRAVKAKESILHRAWLSYVGHKRPGVSAGPMLNIAQREAADLEQKITKLVAKARSVQDATK